MSAPKIFFVTCPCSQHKKFSLTISVKECPGETETCTTLEPCPNAFETFCHKYVNVTFPAGIRPETAFTKRNVDDLKK